MRQMVYRAGGNGMGKGWAEQLSKSPHDRRKYKTWIKRVARERTRRARHNEKRDLEQEFVDHYEHQMIPYFSPGGLVDNGLSLLEPYPYIPGPNDADIFWHANPYCRRIESILLCRTRLISELPELYTALDEGRITEQRLDLTMQRVQYEFDVAFEESEIDLSHMNEFELDQLLRLANPDYRREMCFIWSSRCGCEGCNFDNYKTEQGFAPRYDRLTERLNAALASLVEVGMSNSKQTKQTKKTQRPSWVPKGARWKPLSKNDENNENNQNKETES